MDKSLSEAIRFLRFPLMVAVVFIHTHMGNISVGGESLIQESQFPCFAAVFHLLTDVFARIAVPCFFVISGYLFFYGIKAWNKQVYFAKLKSRVHSLLIPYVFWNVFWVVALYAGQLLFPHLLSGKNRLISDYGWQEWIDVCLANNAMNPFWFIRDLMLLVLATPLFYWMLKRVKYLSMIALFIATLVWVNMDWVVMGIEPIAFFFAGACLSQVDIRASKVCPYRYVLLLVYLLLIGFDFYLWYQSSPYLCYLHKFSLWVGIPTLFVWVMQGFEKGVLKNDTTISNAAFFLFCIHNPIVVFASKLWVVLLSPMTDAKMVCGYLLIPTLMGVGAVCLYLALHKILPRFTAVITGGR
jgi:surface polysaccharide O-acyltransferase-like enzyme